MANLLGQDIGLNYKGLINIGSTINQNISASLQSLTDGDGNLLPLQISTTQMSVGGATGTGRLIVRGDGTNPIFRAENSDGTYRYLMTTTQQIFNTNGGAFSIRPNEGTTNNPGVDINTAISGGTTSIVMAGGRYTITHSSGNNANAGLIFRVNQGINNLTAARFGFETNSSTISIVAGNSYGLRYVDTFAAAAGSAIYEPLSINYTINNSGAQTGRTTGIFLNATETNLNGMTHNLMDLQVGGVSRFNINNVGQGSVRSTSGNIVRISLENTGISTPFTVAGANLVARVGQGFLASGGFSASGWTSADTIPVRFAGHIGSTTPTAFAVSFEGYKSNGSGDRTALTGNEVIAAFGSGDIGTTPANATVRFFANGGVGIRGITPSGIGIHVRGDGTNPIARFENNTGTDVFNVSNTGNLALPGFVAASTGFSTGGANYFFIGPDGSSGTAKLVIRQVSNYLGLYGSNALHAIYRFDSGANLTNTSGTDLVFLGVRNTFNPTSGTASYSNLSIEPTINQTGGANGITRGLYINPTLTLAVDFRGVEVRAGSTSAHDLILLTNAAGNKVFEVNAAQQIGLFGVTPIAQPTTAITGATVAAGSGAPILEDDTFAGFTVAQVIQALVNLGILKP